MATTREQAAKLREKAKAEGMCLQCGKRPPTRGPRGGRTYCDHCRALKNARAKVYYGKNPDKHKEWRGSRRTRIIEAGLCAWCGKNPPTVGPRGGELFCDECREFIRARRDKTWVNYRLMRRLRAIDACGGTCADCGTTDFRVMDFHHANFDGIEQRGNDRGWGPHTRKLYTELIEHGPRADIALLCANCHRIRHWNNSPNHGQ